MAVSRKTQKDIGKYEAKLMGPFTTRQVICIAIGAVPTVAIDYVLYKSGAVDVYTLFGVALLIMIIPCFFGFGQKFCHGQKPEDFIRDYYFYHILAPNVRLHEIESYDDVLDAKAKKAEASASSNGKSKKNKEQIATSGQKKTHKKDKEYPEYS